MENGSRTIYINQQNTNTFKNLWDDVYNLYDERIYLSSNIWTKYIFETHVFNEEEHKLGKKAEIWIMILTVCLKKDKSFVFFRMFPKWPSQKCARIKFSNNFWMEY